MLTVHHFCSDCTALVHGYVLWQLGEEELAKAFGGAGAEGQAEDLMPMMQGLMQSLLSKDILYPSLKEISSKVLCILIVLMPFY